jgi:membrane-bound lytic murein transglycosylase MltF
VERISFQPLTQANSCQLEGNNISNNCQLTVGEVDKVFSAVPDLTNQRFRAWYCKAIYRLGPHHFLELARQARKGKEPTRLFSALLKSHLALRTIPSYQRA